MNMQKLTKKTIEAIQAAQDTAIVTRGRGGCNKTKNPERFHVRESFGGDDQI